MPFPSSDKTCYISLVYFHIMPLLTSSLPQQVKTNTIKMIKSVKVDKAKRYLTLVLEDGNIYSYPWIWLKDNCRCSGCLFDITEARKTQIKDLDLNCVIEDAQVTGKDSTVSISWGDGHSSDFTLAWLTENRFTNDGNEERKHFNRLIPKVWGKEHEKKFLRVDYEKFMTDDRSTFECLVAVEKHGLFLLENCPKDSEALQHLADRLHTCLRVQHHGDNFQDRKIFNIKTSMIQTSDVYTSGRLNHHTDLTYCQFPPCIQLLQCIAQTPSKGGDSIFSDGFKAATELKETHPELFKALTEIPVSSNDFGGYYYDFYMVAYGPTIQLDIYGEVESIRFANHARYAALNAPLERVETFYKAYQKFEEYLEKYHIQFKLREGDMVCFDNLRVTHGRLPFEMTCGSRHLCGSYVEWDDVRSARRVLQRKLKESP